MTEDERLIYQKTHAAWLLLSEVLQLLPSVTGLRLVHVDENSPSLKKTVSG